MSSRLRVNEQGEWLLVWEDADGTHERNVCSFDEHDKQLNHTVGAETGNRAPGVGPQAHGAVPEACVERHEAPVDEGGAPCRTIFSESSAAGGAPALLAAQQLCEHGFDDNLVAILVASLLQCRPLRTAAGRHVGAVCA